MRRVAAIDCGTNSIRLLIAETDEHAQPAALTDIIRLMEVVRLGQGVDRTGRFDPAALQRTLEATDRYAALCREHEVESIRFVATSATRDAGNRQEFIDGVRERLGVEPEVISGDEEASLSFAGATRVLPAQDEPCLVVDIGGGSTELVRGHQALESAISVDIGCVRLTERHLHDDPPTEAQLAAARADITTALDRAEQTVDLHGVGTLIGVAGSITTVTAHALGLTEYDRKRINGAQIPPEQVHEASRQLWEMPRAERAVLGFMHPGRVDVIGAGALVWSEVIARVQRHSPNVRVLTSEHDILDGIAWSLLDSRSGELGPGPAHENSARAR